MPGAHVIKLRPVVSDNYLDRSAEIVDANQAGSVMASGTAPPPARAKAKTPAFGLWRGGQRQDRHSAPLAASRKRRKLRGRRKIDFDGDEIIELLAKLLSLR
jgi:hypothetical protein